jgi:GNAT superfamily N-acetyltransferase
LTELRNRYELAFFGAVETSVDETAEELSLIPDLAAAGLGLTRGDSFAAASWIFPDLAEANVVVDPEDPAMAEACYDRLFRWLGERRASTSEVLSSDAVGLSAVARHAWKATHSSFDLERELGELPAPGWPDDVLLSAVDPDRDAEDLHRAIYSGAGWSQVPGHTDRSFEAWRQFLFLPSSRPDLSTIARVDGRIVGVCAVALFADGLGYVHQLAVDRGHQGRGLGRALLLESFTRLTAGGAQRLGLSVQAGNRAALGLYDSVGLRVVREWIHIARPDQGVTDGSAT